MTTLEQINPFLPYGLKFLKKRMDNKHEIITLSTIQVDKELNNGFDLMFDDEGICQWISDEPKFRIEGTTSFITPILYPLEALYKPIIHEGKEEIPIVECAKIAFPEYQWEFERSDNSVRSNHKGLAELKFTYSNALKGFMLCDMSFHRFSIHNQLAIFRYCYSRRINIENIPFINVYDLEENPYENK